MFGRTLSLPGAPAATLATDPSPAEWWFRPVSIATRVGEHRAVVWNRL